MDWRAALRSRATGIANGHVYWGERPQTTTVPAVLFTAISDDRPQHLKDFDLAPGRIQVDCFANTAQAAWELTESVLTTLVPGGTYNGHNFSRADVSLGPRDLAERIGNSTIFRVSMDLTFFHAENEEAS